MVVSTGQGEGRGEWVSFIFKMMYYNIFHRNGSGFVTQLSFSEADSLSGSHHAHSLAEESGSGRLPETGGMFNTTLECEKRVRLTREQLKFENEFANTSVQVRTNPRAVLFSAWCEKHTSFLCRMIPATVRWVPAGSSPTTTVVSHSRCSTIPG